MANPGEQPDVGALWADVTARQERIAAEQAGLAEAMRRLGAAIAGPNITADLASIPETKPDIDIPLALRRPFPGTYSNAEAEDAVPFANDVATSEFSAQTISLLSSFKLGLADTMREQATLQMPTSFFGVAWRKLKWDATRHPVNYNYTMEFSRPGGRRQPAEFHTFKVVQREVGVNCAAELETEVSFQAGDIKSVVVMWRDGRLGLSSGFSDDFRSGLGTREELFLPDYDALATAKLKGQRIVRHLGRLELNVTGQPKNWRIRLGGSLRKYSEHGGDSENTYADYAYNGGAENGPQFDCGKFTFESDFGENLPRPNAMSIDEFERYLLFALSTIPPSDLPIGSRAQ